MFFNSILLKTFIWIKSFRVDLIQIIRPLLRVFLPWGQMAIHKQKRRVHKAKPNAHRPLIPRIAPQRRLHPCRLDPADEVFLHIFHIHQHELADHRLLRNAHVLVWRFLQGFLDECLPVQDLLVVFSFYDLLHVQLHYFLKSYNQDVWRLQLARVLVLQQNVWDIEVWCRRIPSEVPGYNSDWDIFLLDEQVLVLSKFLVDHLSNSILFLVRMLVQNHFNAKVFQSIINIILVESFDSDSPLIQFPH